MAKNPLEKAIEGDVVSHAKSLGYLVYKFTSPARRSVPDRLFIPPKGLPPFFIEFKRRGELPTPAQVIEISKILAQGTRVFIVDDKAAGRCLVTDIFHGVKCTVEKAEEFTRQACGKSINKPEPKKRKADPMPCPNEDAKKFKIDFSKRLKRNSVDVNNPRDPFF